MAASCGPPGAGTDGGGAGQGTPTSPPSWCYWGAWGPLWVRGARAAGQAQVAAVGAPRGLALPGSEGDEVGGSGLWALLAPGAGWHRMAQGCCTRHWSCLLLAEPVWPLHPVCGAGVALSILCGALRVLHGPAAPLQALHGSVLLAVGPARIHTAGCGSSTAPLTWVRVLHGPAVLFASPAMLMAGTAWQTRVLHGPTASFCGSCTALWHWVLILHGLEVLGAGPARPCDVVDRSCTALWHWVHGPAASGCWSCTTPWRWVLTLRGPAAPGAGAAPSCGTVGGFCRATRWVWGSQQDPRGRPGSAQPRSSSWDPPGPAAPLGAGSQRVLRRRCRWEAGSCWEQVPAAVGGPWGCLGQEEFSF